MLCNEIESTNSESREEEADNYSEDGWHFQLKHEIERHRDCGGKHYQTSDENPLLTAWCIGKCSFSHR